MTNLINSKIIIITIGKELFLTDYFVNKSGKVISTKGLKEKILKECDNGNGYRHVSLRVNGRTYRKYVHRLVASAFIENPENKEYVNHINFNRSDNRVENLEWLSPRENNDHSHNAKRYPEHKRMKRIFCFNNKKYYNSKKDAARDLGLDSSCIAKVCYGKRKHHNGFVFEHRE